MRIIQTISLRRHRLLDMLVAPKRQIAAIIGAYFRWPYIVCIPPKRQQSTGRAPAADQSASRHV